MYYLIVGLLFTSAMAAAVLLVRRKVKRELQPTFDLQDAVNRLSPSEAKASVEGFLQRNGWTFTNAVKEEIRCGHLGNQFFSRFGSISRETFPAVELQLSISQKYYRPDYLEVGIEEDEGLVVMNVKDDCVVALDRGEEIEDGMRFTSIYHYLVFTQKCDDSDTDVA